VAGDAGRGTMTVENTDRTEDADWDAAVLGSTADRIAKLPPHLQGRELESLGILTPLGQILLSSLLQEETVSALYAQSGGVSNPILSAASAHGTVGRRTAPASAHDYVWQPLDVVPTAELNDAFELLIAHRLAEVLKREALSPKRRRRIGFLLFHPLQNVTQHVVRRAPGNREPFAGFSFRVVHDLKPDTPSLRAYLNYIKATAPKASGFLEAIVHDDGEGISGHFARFR